jgi:hypothetical protein
MSATESLWKIFETRTGVTDIVHCWNVVRDVTMDMSHS